MAVRDVELLSGLNDIIGWDQPNLHAIVIDQNACRQVGCLNYEKGQPTAEQDRPYARC